MTTAPSDPYAGERLEPTVDDLAGIAKLAREALEAEKDMQEKEAAYIAAAERHKKLVERDLPGLLDRCGLKKGLVTSDGIQIDLREALSAAVPAPMRERAFDWLDANGHSGLIKRSVQVAFTREEQEKAKDLVSSLEEQGYATVKIEKKVEPATLSAWAREQKKTGGEIPTEFFTLRTVRCAEITRPS